jgi:hypothetical protein
VATVRRSLMTLSATRTARRRIIGMPMPKPTPNPVLAEDVRASADCGVDAAESDGVVEFEMGTDVDVDVDVDVAELIEAD